MAAGYWRCLGVNWGLPVSIEGSLAGCDVGGLRSEPVSSDEAPLLHLGVVLLDLVRLLLRACF